MGFYTKQVEEGSTLQELYESTAPLNFDGCQVYMTLNGRAIHTSEWDNTRIGKNDFACINVVPSGGGGSTGKQIAMVTLMVVGSFLVPFAAVGAAALVGGMSMGAAATAIATGAASIGMYVAAAGVAIAGSMLLSLAQSALMATPSTSNDYTEQIKGFIDGATNSSDPYGIIPINLGTNRIFPKLAANTYTEVEGYDNYVRQLFTYGYGKLSITEEKFGDTSITAYSDYETNYKLNADLNEGTSLYTTDAAQTSYSVLLNQNDAVTRTTTQDCDEVVVDVSFPKGLYNIYSSKGYEREWTVTFNLYYRNEDGYSNFTENSVNLSLTAEQTVSATTATNINYAEVVVNFPNGLYNWEDEDETTKTSATVKFDVAYRNVNSTTWVSLDTWTVTGTYEQSFNVRKKIDLPTTGQYEIRVTKQTFSTSYYEGVNFVYWSVLESYDNEAEQAWVSAGSWSVTEFLKESFLASKRIVFPETGTYDVKIERITTDNPDSSGNDYWGDDSYLNAIKSFAYQNPVNQPNISGMAIRMKATDQLSGSIDTYNCVASTIMDKGYNPTTETWDSNVISSNPADIYRYVLQSPAFAKRVSDSEIDLDKLAEWWVYCNDNNLTYNRLIDYEASIEEVINDICAAGVATPTKIHNVRSVVIDNERDFVKGLVTPRNSWDYSGSIIYTDLPDALRIQFRNKDEDYETDERIVYRDGYTEETAELYETLQFDSCTDSDLAYWYGRRYYATALLQPETHTFKMDFENLTFNRGDRINFISDTVLVGVGQGRVKEITSNGFVIDDTLNIPSVTNLGCRIRHNNGNINYYLLSSVTGDSNTFTFADSTIPSSLEVGNLVAFVEDGQELDLIVSNIVPGSDLTATITAIDYAPARFDPIGEIPAFNSNITLTSGLYQPVAPVLNGDIVSDESVMIKNSDGSYTSLMSIPLLNNNEYDVSVVVRYKLTSGTQWSTPVYLKNTPSNVQIMGLSDGMVYDFEVRYQNKTGSMMLSLPLVLNSVQFIGSSTPPADVQDFKVVVTNGVGLFEWSPNSDFDLSHYIVKYTDETEDVFWENCQPLYDKILSNSFSTAIREGTYMIKAVDIAYNESVNATSIISVDNGAFYNVVETLKQEPDWEGEKDGTEVVTQAIYMTDDVTTGYYYFSPEITDLGENYENSLSYVLNVGISDEDSNVRDFLNIRTLSNIRNLIETNWSTNLEMDLSSDGVSWTGWQQFKAGQQTFRYCKFRLIFTTEDERTRVFAGKASVQIDMPDRYETGEDVEITDADLGCTIVYSSEFHNNPAVNITMQNGQSGDRIEFTDKDKSGFTIKVFNDISNEYVTRSFDYLSAGYGRIITI